MAQKRIRGMRIKIAGAEELERKLKALGEIGTTEMLVKAVDASADLVVPEAERRVRVRTGNLQQHIEKGEPRRFTGRAEIDVGPTDEAWYGRPLELGTKHAPAYPFLRPALDSQRRKIRQTVSDIVKKGIEKVARS